MHPGLVQCMAWPQWPEHERTAGQPPSRHLIPDHLAAFSTDLIRESPPPDRIGRINWIKPAIVRCAIAPPHRTTFAQRRFHRCNRLARFGNSNFRLGIPRCHARLHKLFDKTPPLLVRQIGVGATVQLPFRHEIPAIKCMRSIFANAPTPSQTAQHCTFEHAAGEATS
jgi:hypothetical protein